MVITNLFLLIYRACNTHEQLYSYLNFDEIYNHKMKLLQSCEKSQLVFSFTTYAHTYLFTSEL